MKIDRLIVAFAFVLALSVSPAFGQPKPTGAAPAQTPAQTTAAPVPESKIALIYSDMFLDAKTGIARFNTLVGNLNREFQPRQTELQGLQQRIQALTDDITKTAAVADPKTLQTKQEQLDAMKKEFQRKGEDAQAAYDKRRKEMFTPLQDDIGKALEVYAKSHNINVIFDGSQVPLVYAADALDITRAFINDFNSKNPATAAVTTPPQ
ncbi:MAG TPA: OmpH family outer membrane protein [Pyrinomonadaceae bacterium]|jgi:Skp family chaperone for outer membrane proteins|nr:OmpH family outer membrane protein [Pyrinomonadaceae bacterium]